MEAKPASIKDRDSFDLSRLWHLATLLAMPGGGEHVVFSDGYRRIRIDVLQGTLRNGPVHLRYVLEALAGLDAKILTLRRLLALCRLGRFARNLHPRERLAPRWVAALRAHDAVCEGASYREIAAILYGGKAVTLGRESGSEFLRLRVQRLVRAGNDMMSGGYRRLLG